MLFGAITTALFYKYEEYLYGSFIKTVRTLFAATLGSFDIYSFEEEGGQNNPTLIIVSGTLIFIVFQLISAVTFMNLLIALLSNVYEKI